MVTSLKTGRNWRDPVEKSVRTGRDDRGAEAQDRMEQKKGSNILPKDPKTQRPRDPDETTRDETG